MTTRLDLNCHWLIGLPKTEALILNKFTLLVPVLRLSANSGFIKEFTFQYSSPPALIYYFSAQNVNINIESGNVDAFVCVFFGTVVRYCQEKLENMYYKHIQGC